MKFFIKATLDFSNKTVSVSDKIYNENEIKLEDKKSIENAIFIAKKFMLNSNRKYIDSDTLKIMIKLAIILDGNNRNGPHWKRLMKYNTVDFIRYDIAKEYATQILIDSYNNKLIEQNIWIKINI